MSWLSIVKRNPFVLPMAVVAGLAIFFISEGSYWQSQDAIDDLREITVVRQGLMTLERALIDAETGQRGYLLTGREEYLRPYQGGRGAIQEVLDNLDGHFGDDAAANARLAGLRRLSMSKLDGLDEIIRLTRAGQKTAAMELVAGGAGKRDMDGVRALITQMMAEQSASRQRSNTALDRTLLLNRYGVAALSAVLMLALVLYLRKSDALSEVQASQRAALQAVNDRLETEVSQRTLQLTDLTRHLLNAREDERHRLARNLHDDLGSLLTAAKLDAARIRARLGADAAEAQARLADLVTKLDASVALGRSIIEGLRPSTLDHLGLAATLGILATEFSQRTGVPVHSKFEPVRLKPAEELVVYRVVQEAMTNLSKYAQATQVWITLAPSATMPEMVSVSVRDDGVGFQTDTDSDTASPRRSTFGLLGMRFRVEAAGGSLHVRSQPGQGTEIEVVLPAMPQDG
jgi:signal transduction histidine kinase